MNKVLFAIFNIILGVYILIGYNSAYAEPDLRAVGVTESDEGSLRSDKVNEKLGAVIDEIDKINVSRSTSDITTERSNLSNLSTDLIRVDKGGLIEVYVYCNETGEENLAHLINLGLETEVINEDLKLIQGWLPHDAIEEAAELGFVDRITPPSYGHTRVGEITPNVVSEIGADRVLNDFGIDGSGVKIGVISNGIGNLADSQASGDLPFVQIGNGGTGNEGTAMLEIIHDIAPGAELAFHTGNTSALFIQAVQFFIDNGVDIIVDDIGYLTEPYFQDGSVAEAAGNSVDQGLVYISAAGNDQDRHYQALYIDIDPGDDGANNHDFGTAAGETSTNRMAYSLPGNGRVSVFLQWSNPFGAASDDYDLFVVMPGETEPFGESIDIQNGDDDPLEFVTVENDGGSTGIFEIVIDKFSGEDQELEIVFNGNGSLVEFNVPEDSIYGHPAHPNVIATGATVNGELDFFSSFGPSSIFFNPVVTVASRDSAILNAAPLLEARPKPDISAPNRIATTVPGFANFAGTSAAAPVVAATAALVYQAVEFRNQTQTASLTSTRQTPEEIRAILMSTADDLSPAGFDDMSGAGIVDAFAAVEDALQGLDGPGTNPGGNGGNGSGNGGSGGNGGGCSLMSSDRSSAVSGNALLNLLILLLPVMFVIKKFIRRRPGNA